MKPLQKITYKKHSGQDPYDILTVNFIPGNIPFKPQRAYFLTANAAGQTGQHSHETEEELFLVLRGQVSLISLDSDLQPYKINLAAGEGIYIPNLIWHGFSHISADAIIAGFSSITKDGRAGYLEDQDSYLNTIKNQPEIFISSLEKINKFILMPGDRYGKIISANE